MLKKMQSKFSVLLGFFLLSPQVFAKRNSTDEISKTNFSKNELLLSCKNLIKLELKDNISDAEFNVGLVVYEMLQQLSDSPIEYCDELAMGPVDEILQEQL